MDHQRSDDLSEPDAPETLERLLGLLNRHDWTVNWRAADELARIGRPAVDRLIEALKDKDGYVREAAAKALGKIGDERAVEPLIVAMQYRDAQVYEDDEDMEARASAAIALGKIGDLEAFEPLVLAISDDDLQLSWYVIDALGMLRNARAIPILITALEHWDVDRRKSARSALVNIGEAAVLPLISVIKDTTKRWRIFAIDALSRIGDLRAIGPLTELLDDRDETVRSYAINAIDTISDRYAGL